MTTIVSKNSANFAQPTENIIPEIVFDCTDRSFRSQISEHFKERGFRFSGGDFYRFNESAQRWQIQDSFYSQVKAIAVASFLNIDADVVQKAPLGDAAVTSAIDHLKSSLWISVEDLLNLYLVGGSSND